MLLWSICLKKIVCHNSPKTIFPRYSFISGSVSVGYHLTRRNINRVSGKDERPTGEREAVV